MGGTGGNSRPWGLLKPHRGIEPRCGSFILLAAVDDLVAVDDLAGLSATLGVFFRLEVVNFDLFFGFPLLCLVLHVTFRLLVFLLCQ